MTPFLAKLSVVLPMVFALGASTVLWGLTMNDAPVEVVAAIACGALCYMGWQSGRTNRNLNSWQQLADEWRGSAAEWRVRAEIATTPTPVEPELDHRAKQR